MDAKKVSLRVLSVSGTQVLDTATSIGRLMLSVIGAVGQAERESMLERQREGIAKAKRDGRHKGACADRSTEGLLRSPGSRDAGVTPMEIAARLGIGRASVYRVLAGQHDGEHATA